ncbi:aKG-HExxH-type peptide beta-hydroxylase [Streptomyces brasiliensis]|uniref:aKG-HExxH-type peptide beta-hydroxylase n=1 Tax=Streptomyces brasiliensis TaxID=1954 RepID=UPI00167070A1|nr:HEXXH motif-containing putative peptide modification protein [Streptomyces brasiliensis]
MLPEVPNRALAELGRTEGGAGTLALLVRDQDTRRLLLLRAVLDAAEAADREVCSAAQRTRLRQDWALLAEADRTDRARGRASAARARLTQPLTGPWAGRCLRGLRRAAATVAERRELALDLAHFSTLAAVAAARAGTAFTSRLTPRDGLLALPSLGVLRTDTDEAAVEAVHDNGVMTLRRSGAPDVVVHLERDAGAWSAAPAWTPAYTLPGLLPGAAPVPLDDLDPYRVPPREPGQYALSGPAAPDDTERKRWLQAWSGAAAVLRTGGEHRVSEALALLRCLVPLETPPGSDGGGCSATRHEAFGALLSSVPATPVAFAATLVHELQHCKLAALSEMVTLHQSDGTARYFAPWRPDPRPYEGLLQGAYAHLGLADFFQRRALSQERERQRSASAWVEHARYRAQVGAALPALVGSPHLTVQGRAFVDEMVAAHERMAENPAPRGHTARAQAYVKAARALWTQRHPLAPPTNR